MDNKRYLSVGDFKNWLSEQNDASEFFRGQIPTDPNEKYVGMSVRAKVSRKKLLEKIETEDDAAEQLVYEFTTEGGLILSVEPKSVQIQVESGEFCIPRFCVKIIKD